MNLRTILIGTALACAIAAPARAADFPEFDVKAICHRDANCAAWQFMMRGKVAANWQKLAAAEQTRCVVETADSYETVWLCVDSFLKQ